MKKIYIILVLFIVICPATAQRVVYPENIGHAVRVAKEGSAVHISLDLSFGKDVRIPRQGMVILTPVIESSDGNTYHLAPAVVCGTTRYKSVKRLLAYGNPVFEQPPQSFVKRKNRSVQAITLSYTLPYEKWMQGADILLYGDASGCVNCGNAERKAMVQTDIFPPAADPHYLVSYIVPEAEVKERSETFVARINYVVARYELLPNFGNNATVLQEVDKVIRELQHDPDLTIIRHTVTGYASPEGNFNSNITLSRNRARSFMNYLQNKYNWKVETISYDGKGEDWDGLREAVDKQTYTPYREEVLMIIDRIPDIARRKRSLQALEGGRVYAQLLREVYPPLRRNEFEIAYIARPFNVEEAREIIKTRPHLLNLNEMFLVANSYPKDSKEFKEVFDIATRLYPDNPVSKVNAGAMEIETGAIDRGVERLTGVESAEAWNNLGVGFAKKGDTERAKAYFERAAQAGDANARHNLGQLTGTE